MIIIIPLYHNITIIGLHMERKLLAMYYIIIIIFTYLMRTMMELYYLWWSTTTKFKLALFYFIPTHRPLCTYIYIISALYIILDKRYLNANMERLFDQWAFLFCSCRSCSIGLVAEAERKILACREKEGRKRLLKLCGASHD
jgi:hypothetical protein